jgi:hypothetical protein
MSQIDEPSVPGPTATVPGPTPTATPIQPTGPAPKLPLPETEEEDKPADAEGEENAPDKKEKVDWGRKVLENRNKLLLGLLALLLVGLGGWYYSLSKAAQSAAPNSAVSTDQIDRLAVAPTAVDAPEPAAAMDQNIQQEQNATSQPEEVQPDKLLATNTEQGPINPTPAEQAQYRASMAQAARANNTDSVMATRRDPNTGQYSQQRVAQRRVAFSQQQQPSRAQPFNAVTPASNGFANSAALAAPRPTRATDGTPYETNDEINMMLTNLPEGVKATYERMSGKRFRPLLAGQQQQVNDRSKAMQYIPGMDGFNTVKFRGSNANGQEDLESALVPDIFYRCTIQGTQEVRSGSVVLLRLSEDATLGGVTFPRNMVFSALASVESNRVNLIIDRLGPHRVAVEIYNYSYMPGIMIDPGKRAQAPGNQSMSSTLQTSSTQELSNAIAQSQQAANSWQGIAGRMGVTMLSRMPKAGTKLRDVTLPDGYPILLTSAQQGKHASYQQAGPGTQGGMMGQDGNPMQSPLMQGVGQGGYPMQPGYQNLPPAYVPQPGQQGGVR